MPAMRIFTTIPQHNLQASKRSAEAMEIRGFTGICTLENRHDPFLPLAVAATSTSSSPVTHPVFHPVTSGNTATA